MPTPQSRLIAPALAALRERAPQSVAIDKLYEVVEAHVALDADDYIPPTLRGRPTGEPSWHRNLRNALQQEKREGRLANVVQGEWALPSPDPSRHIDPDAAWDVVVAAAKGQRGQVFTSPGHDRRYRVGEVTAARIQIERLDASKPSVLTPGVVRRAVVALNATGGRAGVRTLNYTVAIETAIVHLHRDIDMAGDTIQARRRESVAGPSTTTEAIGLLTRKDILKALDDLDRGAGTLFAESTVYDLLHEGRRYAPLQVVAMAAEPLLGKALHPHSSGTERGVVLKGGLGSPAFRALDRCGFDIVPKEASDASHPDELQPVGARPEGGQTRVWVNRYERDDRLRDACLAHHGAVCQACEVDMGETYGTLGDGFVHVHHIRPLAEGEERETDPVRDLVPVCPNCHAMLHRGRPAAEPRTIEELRRAMGAA